MSICRVVIALAFLLSSLAVSGQERAAVLTRSEMAKKLNELRVRASSSSEGSASIRLADYPHHYTMLAFRTRTGEAEVHRKFADIFVVFQGHATLITGGNLVSPREEESEEPRGKSVEGGAEQKIKPGDIVHIPAGVPHQIVVSYGDKLFYFVTKVQEQ